MFTGSPGLQGAQGGHLQRMRNDAHVEAVRLDAVHRQAHAIDAHGALARNITRQLRRHFKFEALRTPVQARVTGARPRPSTWPLTRCPPRRSAARSAGSRLTCRRRSSHRGWSSARVSVETSALKPASSGRCPAWSGRRPDTHMLSPSARVRQRPACSSKVMRRSAPTACVCQQAAPVFDDSGKHAPRNIAACSRILKSCANSDAAPAR